EGIGKELAAKIKEIVKTGSLKMLIEIEQRMPPQLIEMLRIPGLGPKRVKTLYERLGITSLDALRQAAAEGKIRALEGFGPKIEQNILEELDRLQGEEQRIRLDMAEQLVEPLLAYLRHIEGVERAEVAGSYRRRKETVGDLDILATGEEGARIIERFVSYEDVQEIVSQGETRSTVRLRLGVQVDLRVVAQESYGAALLYFTGSKPHNIALRNMALKRELKINEYGVFRGQERVAGETEEGIYQLLGLAFIPPELREDRGEIQAAQEGRLPRLIKLEDLRGDLQTHTQDSDGHATLREMACAA
ncbi:MAG: DNA polymerase III, partial [Chloroflexi bacterium]|nr:DNA polymerase III [Chloroflexota bacterium]